MYQFYGAQRLVQTKTAH